MAIVRSGGVRVPRLEGGGDGSPEETDEEGGESPATLLQEYDAAASFSGEEEEEEENGGGGEEEGEEEEEEDSGMGSDELEITELGEAGAELCQVGDQSVAVPLELYDLPGLGGVLSLDAWNGLLSEDERLRLAAFLPDMDQETFARTLVELLSGSNFHFGSPLAALFNQLKGALCDPRIVLYRRGVRFAERRKHYYWLQSYHNSMVRRLWDIKDCWNVCEGYSLEERLHALDGMKAQQQQKQDWGLGLRGPAGSETDSESRESGERFLTRQKTEKAGLKKGGKYGKDKSKGLLRVGVSKGLAEEHIGGAGHDAAMALSELSRHDRVRGYDSGVVRGGKLQRGADGLDPEELGYDRDLQRDCYAAQKPMLKPRKKKGLAASYDIDMYEKDYPDSHAGSPYYHGKNVSANQGVTLAAYNPPYFDTGKNAKYQERDWMYGGKGVSNKALRRDQMNWPAGSRTDNLGDWQRGKPTVDCRSGKAQAGYGLKSKSYKSIEQHFNDASFGSDPRGKILQGKTKGKSSSRYDRLGQKYSNSGTIYPQSEETESDSSEQFEDSGHTNLLGQQPDLHHYGSHRPSYDAKRPNKLPKGVKRDYSGVAADFEHYQTKGTHKGKVGEPGYLRDVHVTMKDQISEMMRPQAVRGERKRKGMTDLDMYGYGISEMHDSKENVKETFRSLESESLASRSGYGVQDSNGDFGGLERVRVPLSGCSSSAKKQKGKVQVMSLDEHGEYLPSGSKQQMDNSGSSKKKGKRKPETLTDAVTVAAPPAPVLPENSVVAVEPEKPQKKYVPITPTIHTGFSFSIVHLLSAVRKAMVTPTEDTSVAGKHPSGEDSKTKLNNEERNKTLQGPSATQQTQQGHEATDASAAGQTVLSNLPALTVQELVNKIKSNPGDPCILETQEPLQDLVRGVLKILSSKTAPLGAKGWKALVSYDKSNKSWFWVGPLASGSSGNDPIEEETSAEAWGIPHKMLVKLVDAFANWLKSGQETLKQIGSLPSPPPPNPANLDLKERFKDLRAQKSLNTISPSSDEARAYFQREEFLRYSIPDRAFCYTAADGEKSIVAPLRRGGGKPTAKARGHPMLLPDRPPHVTILCLVRDAAARLPARTGTRADVCTLLKDSQYLNQEEANKEAAINQVVSGALDRLHYERDPCVLYDNDKKLWTYLHRGREEEDFEDDGTSSTKKWKRPRKDPSDPAEPGAANDDIDDEGTPSTNSAKKTRKVPIDPAASGPAKDAADNASQDPSAGGFSGGLEGDPDLNVIPSTINGEETSGTVYTDAKSDIGSSSAAVDTTPGSRAEGNSVGWQAFPGQDNNMVLPDSTKGIS